MRITILIWILIACNGLIMFFVMHVNSHEHACQLSYPVEDVSQFCAISENGDSRLRLLRRLPYVVYVMAYILRNGNKPATH